MHLTKKEIKRHYAALGIQKGDLVSAEDIRLAEIPGDARLRDAEERGIAELIHEWNRLGDLAKVAAAQKFEQRVLHERDPEPLKRVCAWAAYLMLGRVRNSEERRDVMQKVARGEASAPILGAARPPRRTATRLTRTSAALTAQVCDGAPAQELARHGAVLAIGVPGAPLEENAG